jgi:hypothetical protein
MTPEPTPDPNAVLLRVPDVAERLGLSRLTVERRYVKTIPGFFKLAGKNVIIEADLAAWMAARRDGGSAGGV